MTFGICDFSTQARGLAVFQHGSAQHLALRYPTLGADLAQAIDIFGHELLAAKRPVLYAGGGCNSPEVATALAALLQEVPMPGTVTGRKVVDQLSGGSDLEFNLFLTTEYKKIDSH